MRLSRTWVRSAFIPLDETSGELPHISRLPESLTASLDAARVIFLGETNHFVQEKSHFRYCWLAQLAQRYPLVIAEELSAFDGKQVKSFLQGDETALQYATTFGSKSFQRDDRDDSPRGIFGQTPYPYDLMLAEHSRFYRWLRQLPNIQSYIGFDVDAPGAGLANLVTSASAAGWSPEWRAELIRVPGESIAAEIARLERLARAPMPASQATATIALDLQSMIDSLRYAAMIQDAADYEAVRPAMVFREQVMKRHIEAALAELPPDTKLVLMGHAFHLAKDDAHIEQQGVGPGGDQVPSLGHHIHRVLNQKVASIWMLYGKGTDAQPLPGLSNRADYPADSLNRKLAALIDIPAVLPALPDCHDARVGHLYNAVVSIDISAEADAITFFPEVHPLQQDP